MFHRFLAVIRVLVLHICITLVDEVSVAGQIDANYFSVHAKNFHHVIFRHVPRQAIDAEFSRFWRGTAPLAWTTGSGARSRTKARPGK